MHRIFVVISLLIIGLAACSTIKNQEPVRASLAPDVAPPPQVARPAGHEPPDEASPVAYEPNYERYSALLPVLEHKDFGRSEESLLLVLKPSKVERENRRLRLAFKRFKRDKLLIRSFAAARETMPEGGPALLEVQ